jgi:Uma2 family endonuclease
MATAHTTGKIGLSDYPTSDGRPMAETDWHRDLMLRLIETLKIFYASDPRTYVSGNLLIFYQPGNKRRHVSPDVFVVKGVSMYQRPNYLVWEEGKGPDVVIELTSKTTRTEDVKKKFALYQDTLCVPEYFLFDPLCDYLEPPMQGYRLRKGKYVRIRPVEGRLPSKVLGLHLERDGKELRLFNPEADRWIPTPEELLHAAEDRRRHAEDELRQAEDLRRQAEDARRQAEGRAEQLEEELRRLRRPGEGS